MEGPNDVRAKGCEDKRNKKAVLVRIRIKIGIALKEIKTKGRQGPKDVRVQWPKQISKRL